MRTFLLLLNLNDNSRDVGQVELGGGAGKKKYLGSNRTQTSWPFGLFGEGTPVTRLQAKVLWLVAGFKSRLRSEFRCVGTKHIALCGCLLEERHADTQEQRARERESERARERER